MEDTKTISPGHAFARVACILALLGTACSSEGNGSSSSASSAAGGAIATGGAVSMGPSGGGTPGSGGAPASVGLPNPGPGGAAGAIVVGSGGAVNGNTGGHFSAGGNGGGGGSGGGAGVAGGGGSAGGAGAAGTSGAAGSASYSPCPSDSSPCKILPLGDSITYGLGTSDQSAYRVELFKKARAAGKHITYVGSVMAGPTMVDGVMFPRNNEGHSGWTIDQIAGIVPNPALKDNPDIILLMIGTNDMYMGSPGTAPQRLATLLDKIIGVSDHPLLVVAQITPLSSGSSAVQTFNAALPAIVNMRAAAGKHIKLVDMYTGFSTSMLADGVHPNAQGNAKMAEAWWPAIEGVLH